jgi:hypothetical protein
MKIKISQRKLKPLRKRAQTKYLILLSDQTVIIDSEWVAMKKAIRYCREKGKHIQVMLPTYARVNAKTTGLTKLLETLETTKQ